MEGVHRQTQKNHALKLVSRGGRLRATKVLGRTLTLALTLTLSG